MTRGNTKAFSATPFLSEHHRKMLLDDSSIGPTLIDQRGYFTAVTAAEIAALGFPDSQCQFPALVLPLWTVDGEIGGYQTRPDKPRLNEHGKPVKYETPAGWSMRIDVPPAIRTQLDDPSEPLWITEGIKKADSAVLRGLCCIGLLGVWNFRGTNAKGGITELEDWDRIPLKSRRGDGRTVYIVYDSDIMEKEGVRASLRKLAQMLKRRGAKDVRPVLIPCKEGEKVGLDDFFAAGGTAHTLKNSIDYGLLRCAQIVVNGRSLPDITDDALRAFNVYNNPPTTFVRAGEMVRLDEDERGIVKIGRLNEKALRGILARAATWAKMGKDGPTEIAPPLETVQDVISLGSWPDIPPIVGVTRAPVLSKEGVITMRGGYCARSHMFVAGKETWPLWTGTTAEAVRFIFEEVLVDFPFAGAADRAHALALMLLPIIRPVISGSTPLHLIDAPVQSTGKTLLAKACLMPTQGPDIFTTPGTKDEEEWRKRITSSLLDGRAYILFDNLTRKVESEHLANALTTPNWSDRGLGASTNVNCAIRCTWVATGNNIDLDQDILERTVWIRLDAKTERPQDRSRFKHENIEAWISDNRPLIVAALCHIVMHWVEKDQPHYTGRINSKYMQWCNTIGSILECAGVEGFLANTDELRDVADADEPAWLGFYEGWYTRFGTHTVKAGELIDEFKSSDDLAAKLEGCKGDASAKAKLGKLIRSRVGVVVHGLSIERAGDRAGSMSYRIVKAAASNGGVGTDLFDNPTIYPTKILASSDGVENPNLGSNGGDGGVMSSHMYAQAHAHVREEGNHLPTPPFESNAPDSYPTNLTAIPPPTGVKCETVDMEIE